MRTASYEQCYRGNALLLRCTQAAVATNGVTRRSRSHRYLPRDASPISSFLVLFKSCCSGRLSEWLVSAYAEFSLIQINFVRTKFVPGRTEISLSDKAWTTGRMPVTLYSRLLRIRRCCHCRISAANNNKNMNRRSSTIFLRLSNGRHQ